MSTIFSFRSIENKHDVYRGKDCIKKFCEFVREHAMKIINFEKEKKKLLTEEHKESYENAKICYIFKENFEISIYKIKNILKLQIIVIIQENIEVLRIAYVISNIACLKKFP